MMLLQNKYKHLYAWDMMQHSSSYWVHTMQERAVAENAPEDVVYVDSNGVWHTFSEIKSEKAKDKIQVIVKSIG